MARPDRIETRVGFVAVPAPVRAQLDGTFDLATIAAKLNDFMEKFGAGFNGNVSLGDGRGHARAGNLDAVVVEDFYFEASDVEYKIPHALGRIPWGYFVAWRDRAGDIYITSRGSWTADQIILASEVSAMHATLLVF